MKHILKCVNIFLNGTQFFQKLRKLNMHFRDFFNKMSWTENYTHEHFFEPTLKNCANKFLHYINIFNFCSQHFQLFK